VLTVLTCTGFATADFDLWPNFSRALLLLLMFIGGCAGSTSGSIKIVRILLVFKTIGVAVKRLVQPHAVLPVRLGLRPVPDDVVTAVMTFVVLYLLFVAGGGLSLTMMGLDPMSAFSAAATCMANIGPGFGEVGPMRNFSAVPDPGKLVLTALMIVGRLELYTVLVTLFLLRRRA
jgi:trk system potassium uptake protein TrkH